MTKQVLVLLILAGGMCLAQQSNTVPTPQSGGWIPLFNGKDFGGWHKFLEMRSKKDTGLVDHNLDRIFQIVDGSIHMYRDSPQDAYVPEGFLMTEKAYANYRLKLEFKWGNKKFAQRAGRKRNSGLMFHAQDTTGFWPTSMECQVMEGDVGDIYTQNHAWCTTTIDTIVVDSLSSKMWNIRHIDPQNPNEARPLLKGRILLQAEATEIMYRDVMIREEEPDGAR